MKEEISKPLNSIQALMDEMREMGQPRSNYVLDHFVIGQHSTPETQRKQVLDELYALMFSIGDSHDDMRLAELEAQEYEGSLEKATGIQAERLKVLAAKAKRKALALEIMIEGRIKEVEHLLAALDKLPKVSRAEFEAAQSHYWSVRLPAQFYLGQRDHGGNLAAILQMATEVGSHAPRLPITLQEVLTIIDPNLRVISNAENGGNLPSGNGS
jgi:predicted DNA-binding protein